MFDPYEIGVLEETLDILQNVAYNMIHEDGVSDTDPRITLLDSLSNQLEDLVSDLQGA